MNFADNCSLLISLTTMPFSDEKSFYENDLEGLIKGYKKKQQDFARHRHPSQNKDRAYYEFENYLYVPRPYFMFGNYDLALVSLIDDYTLTNRNFHPYSYFVANDREGKKRDHSYSFKYQIITGPMPIIAKERNPEEEYILEKARQTFLAQHEVEQVQKRSDQSGYAYPFIAISRVKINNSLLIGSGAKLVALIEHALKQILEEKFAEDDLDFIISESFGWHELTLVFFFTSFRKISEVLIKLRELKLEDLLKYDAESGFYDHVLKHCLLQDFIEKDLENHPHCETCEAHIFLTTLTSFGFDFELLDNYEIGQQPPQFDKRFKVPEIDEATFHLLIKWNVKPGHLENVLNNFRKGTRKSSVNFMVGGEDYIFPVEQEFANLRGVFNFFKGAILNPEAYPERYDQIKYHARKINTTPQVRYTLEELAALIKREEQAEENAVKPTARHYFFHKNLRRYAFSLAALKEIRELLYSCQVSKILREKILNMFVNYNDGIQDPILFIYFIELRPYLVRIKREIEWFSQNFVFGDKLHETLDQLVIAFEQAFKNRFQQSHRMDGVTDFNMEFNGGCQQIISSLDGAYKVISGALGEYPNPTSFVVVSGLAGVDSSMFSMRLNYFHIFQPSIFMASSVKESVNHYFHRRNLVEDTFHGEDTALSYNLNKLKGLKKNLRKVEKKYKDTHPGFYGFRRIIDNTMLLNFQSDIITYLYGYNMDSELFSFWYWNNFMQISSNYNSDGALDQDNFLKFLIRHILVLEFLDPEYMEQKSDYLSLDNIPNIQISDLWIMSFAKIRHFIQILLEDKDCQLNDWLASIAKVGLYTTLFDTLIPPPDEEELQEREGHLYKDMQTTPGNFPKERRKVIQNKLNRIYARFPGLPFADEEKTALEVRYLRIDGRVEKFRRRFVSGDLIQFNYDDQNKESPSLFLQSLSYAYLKLLMSDLMRVDQKKNPLLLRYEANEILTPDDISEKENKRKGMVHLLEELEDFALNRHNGALVFDPMGGLFSVHHNTRRKYYQYRSTLIRSLWDFSLKMKKQLFEPIELYNEPVES